MPTSPYVEHTHARAQLLKNAHRHTCCWSRSHTHTLPHVLAQAQRAARAREARAAREAEAQAERTRRIKAAAAEAVARRRQQEQQWAAEAAAEVEAQMEYHLAGPPGVCALVGGRAVGGASMYGHSSPDSFLCLTCST